MFHSMFGADFDGGWIGASRVGLLVRSPVTVDVDDLPRRPRSLLLHKRTATPQ